MLATFYTLAIRYSQLHESLQPVKISRNKTPHTHYRVLAIISLNAYNNKKLSYCRDSARCVKRPFKVTQGHPLLCQSTWHIGLPISIH